MDRAYIVTRTDNGGGCSVRARSPREAAAKARRKWPHWFADAPALRVRPFVTYCHQRARVSARKEH